MSRRLSWFSCGAASAVATKLALLTGPVEPVYCETGAEHPDNERFLAACEDWFGVKVTRVKSAEFADTWAVWEKRSYLAGIDGAPCTAALKIVPRVEYQRPADAHIFGYTADANDVERAKRLRGHYFELTIETPLIDRGLTKQGCLAMIENAGIKPPAMYALGFANNNCIPCVKATSAGYWALVRREFPEQFARMTELSRKLGVRLCRINGERAFIDEIPAEHPTSEAIAPACDFLCHLAEKDLVA